MEDTQEKARRNLVVFCSVVLFCAWLGLDEVQLIKRVFGGDNLGSGVSATRAVIVALVVVIYLSLRYRFTQSFQSFLHSLSGEWSTRVGNESMNFLNSHLRVAASKSGISGVFSDDIRTKVRTAHGISSNVFDDENFELKLWVSGITFRNPFEGSTSLTVQAKNNITLQEYSSSGSGIYNFKIHGFNKFKVKSKTVIKLVMYSEMSVEHLIPIALAALSLVLLTTRLIMLNC